MSKFIILLLLLLSLINTAPVHAQEMKGVCNQQLVEAGVNVAQLDTYPEGVDPKYWEYTSRGYVTSYHLSSNYSVLKVVSMNGKQWRLMGLWYNGVWVYCDKSNGWKNYLTSVGE